MFALLQPSTSVTLGFLSVTAGFLVIVASVAFVIKGKAVLNDSGAPNVVEWGKIKANLTSAVTLFVLGAVMILLPFWRFQQEDAKHLEKMDGQLATAVLKSNISGPGGGEVRLLLVVKPDYDQTYRGGIVWEFPLLAGKASYSVIYTQEGVIIGEQPFLVERPAPGSAPQKISLPPLNLQIARLRGEGISAQDITPQLDISNEEVKNTLSVR